MIQQAIFVDTPERPALAPVLKWAGGKRWLVPRLREMFAPYHPQRLVEPFVGGMAVVLGLEPNEAILNDVNFHLINLYRWIRRGLTINVPTVNDRETYDQHRRRFNELIKTGWADTQEAASLFYYLNRTGFNGLCRFNSKGLYNVPFGKYATVNYAADFLPYAERLSKWTFTLGDFELIQCRPTDFIYADPPYDTPFTSYSAGGFSWADQVRCAEWLAAHVGPVVASNQATDRVLDLYRSLGFTLELVDAPRRISCDGDRTPAREMLAWRNLEAA